MVIQYVNWMYLVECSLNLTFWQFYYPADDKCRWKHLNERTNFWYETYSDKVNRQISRLMYKNIWKFISIVDKWYCWTVSHFYPRYTIHYDNLYYYLILIRNNDLHMVWKKVIFIHAQIQENIRCFSKMKKLFIFIFCLIC